MTKFVAPETQILAKICFRDPKKSILETLFLKTLSAYIYSNFCRLPPPHLVCSLPLLAKWPLWAKQQGYLGKTLHTTWPSLSGKWSLHSCTNIPIKRAKQLAASWSESSISCWLIKSIYLTLTMQMSAADDRWLSNLFCNSKFHFQFLYLDSLWKKYIETNNNKSSFKSSGS